jgi:hypothetical protein
MSTIYTKTAKGQDEIDTRGQGLSQGLRRVLIMVDGRSSAEELAAKMLQDVSAALQELAAGGYIATGAGAAATGGDASVGELKQELIGIAKDILGKHADRVVQKIQSSPDDMEGMKAAVDDCQKFVRLFIDEAQAEVLFTKCRATFQKYT